MASAAPRSNGTNRECIDPKRLVLVRHGETSIGGGYWRAGNAGAFSRRPNIPIRRRFLISSDI